VWMLKARFKQRICTEGLDDRLLWASVLGFDTFWFFIIISRDFDNIFHLDLTFDANGPVIPLQVIQGNSACLNRNGCLNLTSKLNIGRQFPITSWFFNMSYLLVFEPSTVELVRRKINVLHHTLLE